MALRDRNVQSHLRRLAADIFNLSSSDPHHLDGVADDVGGERSPLGPLGIAYASASASASPASVSMKLSARSDSIQFFLIAYSIPGLKSLAPSLISKKAQ